MINMNENMINMNENSSDAYAAYLNSMKYQYINHFLTMGINFSLLDGPDGSNFYYLRSSFSFKDCWAIGYNSMLSK